MGEPAVRVALLWGVIAGPLSQTKRRLSSGMTESEGVVLLGSSELRGVPFSMLIRESAPICRGHVLRGCQASGSVACLLLRHLSSGSSASG